MDRPSKGAHVYRFHKWFISASSGNFINHCNAELKKKPAPNECTNFLKLNEYIVCRTGHSYLDGCPARLTNTFHGASRKDFLQWEKRKDL